MIALFDALKSACRAVAALCVLAILVILFASIVMRELLGLPLVWANEVSITLFVWTVFLGVGVATADNAHIAFDIVVARLPVVGRRLLRLAVAYGGLVLLAGFFATSVYVAYVYRDQRFTTIAASATWQWAAVPVGMLLAVAGWIRHGNFTWQTADGALAAPTDLHSI